MPREPLRLCADCWSVVLAFLPWYNKREAIIDRFCQKQPTGKNKIVPRHLLALTSKAIYRTLPSSFAGQLISLVEATVPHWAFHQFRKTRALDLTLSSVTDQGLAHLSTVRQLNLCCCSWITDDGMAHLRHVRRLRLSGTDISDAGLRHFTDLEEINIACCQKITDAGLAGLARVKVIDLSCCLNITNEGMQHLSGATTVSVSGCHITDAGLAFLTSAEHLNVSQCDITTEGFATLSNLKEVDLSVCLQIGEEFKSKLRANGVTVVADSLDWMLSIQN
jgi:hypothetical protein